MASPKQESTVFTTALYEPTSLNEPQSLYAQDTAYHGTDPDGHAPEREPGRSILSTLLLQMFSLAWLVPAVTLLVLNTRGHIIGASAWCPSGDCYVQANDNVTSVPQQRMAYFDSTSHNLLGLLQIVAKLMELWFGFIATALVYLIVMQSASRPHGLPIRCITLSTQFTDTLGMLSPKLWKSLSVAGHVGAGLGKVRGDRVGLAVVVSSAILCVLCNLMGPATAVLVIPSLQWLDSPVVNGDWYIGYETDVPPQVNGWAFNDSGCTVAEYQSYNFTCAKKWALNLDSWVASSAASVVDSPDGSLLSMATQQRDIFFYVNVSRNIVAREMSSELVWVPSRQLMDSFSEDKRIIANISQGLDAEDLGISRSEYESYAVYNKSLQLELQRTGPILGAFPNINGHGLWTTQVDANRSIMCFSEYALTFPIAGVNNFTKCIQLRNQGAGWNEHTQSTQVLVESLDGPIDASNASRPSLDLFIYSSERAVLLPNGNLEAPYQLPNGSTVTHQPECIEMTPANLTVSDSNFDCNWDYFFGDSYNAYSSSNATTHVNSMLLIYSEGNDQNDRVSLLVDFVVFFDFTTYTFDPASFTNPMSLVQTPVLPAHGQGGNDTVFIHPAWWLAALSLDDDKPILPASRSVSQMMFKIMKAELSGLEDPDVSSFASLAATVYIPLFQTLSLANYEVAPGHNWDTTQLNRMARMQVWAYGMSSRTAVLGITIVVAGIMAVLLQFFLGLGDRRQSKSLTQILVAALAHQPHDEFSGGAGDELKVAGTRFSVHDDGSKPGKLRFEAL
ncbi:hypothetical protein B0A48_16205 [Cryoendolithus antarcticus]|uniref:Uncharacterized protein n=1 Tax=Cryoendolithus antarcticus TaxID=1507870 RepID=A0A1V8SFG1_9PEZI|nr:hypothetical protein B0A48_16205 [Cryoendolithus antarcticus]